MDFRRGGPPSKGFENGRPWTAETAGPQESAVCASWREAGPGRAAADPAPGAGSRDVPPPAPPAQPGDRAPAVAVWRCSHPWRLRCSPGPAAPASEVSALPLRSAGQRPGPAGLSPAAAGGRAAPPPGARAAFALVGPLLAPARPRLLFPALAVVSAPRASFPHPVRSGARPSSRARPGIES